MPEPDDEADLAALRNRCARALSDIGRFAVVGGLAAAKLHGLWVPSGSITRPEIVVVAADRPARSVTGTQRSDVLARRRSLVAAEYGIVDGLPLTTPAKTWLGLAASLAMPDLIALGDSVLRSGAGQVAALDEAIRRGRRQRGIVKARAAISLLDAGSPSRPESHLRAALVLEGLPKPEVNVAILDELGGWLAEPDLVYRRARLALEYNGADHASVKRMRSDIGRTLDVEAGGWHVVTFGPRQVFAQPHLVAAHVRALLDIRDPGWRRRPPPSSDGSAVE